MLTTDEFEAGLGRLQGWIATHFDGVGARFDGVAERFAQQDRRFEAVERRLDRLGAELIEVRTQVMERIDRLQDLLTSTREDLVVNLGASHRAQDSAEHTRAELRSLGEVVTGMQRQIVRLQNNVRELRGEA